jgi:hypothetical protein
MQLWCRSPKAEPERVRGTAVMAKLQDSIIVLQVHNLSAAYHPDVTKEPCQAFDRVANKHHMQPVRERSHQTNIV